MNMPTAASNQYKRSPRTIGHLIANRFTRLLVGAIIALGCVCGANAAEVGLGITFSPEAAHMIRDWRRAHGLPQAPETTQVQAPPDGSNAIEKAIRYAGLEGAARNDLVVAVSRLSSHWQVTIHVTNTPDSSDYVIEVADAAANVQGATRNRS
jgi:hypothetical protein